MEDKIDSLACRSGVVQTPDGLNIAVQEWGNPLGHAIIFIHGFSQCHLSWSRQYASRLAREFRMITYDLRGHGLSDKPRMAEFYREGHRWADELASVIDHKQVIKPVLVAWSYGGRIVSDYLSHYGATRLAGINLVGSKTNSDAKFYDASISALQQRMADADLESSIVATIDFLKVCSGKWDAGEFNYHLAFNMVVPSEVRGYLLGRHFDADSIFQNLDLPVLFSHGKLDRIAPYSAAVHGHAIAARSRLSVYEAAGHCPFIEEHERFNDELGRFVRDDCAS